MPSSRPPRARKRARWTADDTTALPAVSTPTVRALTRDDVSVVYQPIVDLQSGATWAVESLVRCRVPEFRNPMVLFAQAVTEDMCGRLGRLIRDVTFQAVSGRRLFVNLHPAELSARWLVQPDDPLTFHDGELYLEVTEATAFDHFDLCKSALRELRQRTGAFIVVDDFGAGHSNLKRVIDLEPRVVKLDLALTKGIDVNRRQQKLVASMVRLFNEIDALVVAEGIETADELAAICDAGAQYGQGYFLARPANPVPPVNWPYRGQRS